MLLASLPTISVIHQLFSDWSLRCINCQSEAQNAFHWTMVVLQVNLIPKFNHIFQDYWAIETQHMLTQDVYLEAVHLRESLMSCLPRKTYSFWRVYLKAVKIFAKRLFSDFNNIVESLVEWKPYFGSDGHNGSSSLSFREHFWFMRTPSVHHKFVIWPQIRPVAMKQLLNIFLTVGNNTRVHRKCSYCRQIKPTRTDGDTVERTVTLWLPGVWSVEILTPIRNNLDEKQSFQVGIWWVLL